MQIAGRSERLPDQGRADHPARLVADQTAVGLGRENGLGHAGYGQGIGDAQDAGEQGDHHDRRTDLAQHQKVAFRLATARLS
ncbi:hypothetical protein D3C81_1269960 [compost metagenome]